MPDEIKSEQEETQEVTASADADKGMNDVEATESTAKISIDPDVVIQAAVQDAARKEIARTSEITELGKRHGESEIAARAVKEGWDVNEAAYHILQASKTHADQESGVFTVGASKSGSNGNVKSIEAAVLMSTGRASDDVLAKTYDDQTLESADKMRNIGICDLARMCAQIDGIPLGSSIDHIDTVRAAFSGTSLSGILGDSARKVMLNAYKGADSTAKIISKKLNARDFKTHKGHRMTASMDMEKVGQTGELKHGTLGEESYSYSVDTYGRMIGLTRQDVINDDLGAFMEVPELVGKGAAKALELIFWTMVLGNDDDFFGTDNSNYDASAGTSLDSESLSEAVAKMREQKDASGHPAGARPKYLLVPPGLEQTARELFVSTNIAVGGGSSKTRQPTENTHKNMYTPVVCDYLSDSNITGYSSTAWYLLADPTQIPAFGIAYLRGNEAPTIEEVNPSPDYLGRMWRGYFDFGVCQVDYRGGVKYAGTAAS